MGNGSIYKGEVNDNGVPHGRGIMIYSDGSINEGYWMNSKRFGMNHYKTLDGNSFIGNFDNDLPHGTGSETIEN